MFDCSVDECLGVQIGWYCCAVDIHRCEDNRHAESKMREPVELSEQSLEDQGDTGQQGFSEDQVGTGGVRHSFDSNRNLTTMS